MKVKLSWKKVLVMWLLVFVVMAALIYLPLFNLFFLTKWGLFQIITTSLFGVVMIVVLILSLNAYYYEINKKDLTVSKFGKKYTFFYSDIIYIDDEESVKTKTLCFVTKYGHVKYLTFDKEGKIYEAVKARCNNLISKEEVKSRFPSIKI